MSNPIPCYELLALPPATNWVNNTARNQAIIEAYERGETLERIAAAFEISIARVHQILKHRN